MEAVEASKLGLLDLNASGGSLSESEEESCWKKMMMATAKFAGLSRKGSVEWGNRILMRTADGRFRCRTDSAAWCRSWHPWTSR